MNKIGWELFVSSFFIMMLSMSSWAQEEKEVLPTPPREFRAAWVATVANIDWPSEPGLSVKKQKEEAIAILDKIKELNMNAVVFQVRPHADAMYKSDLEPWSYYLTGEQGKAPDPFYDPLEFWVNEAHARGIEIHTWYNPYRANHPAMKGPISEKSLVKARPNLVRKLGDKGYYWMDPAMKEVQDHSVAVVLDVVKRYDIDGVHFDDYFYPYPEYNNNKDFPDDETWKAYQESGGKLSRGDWRREAVNVFVKRLSKEIKSIKPHVKFSISPFGIYRPGYPESIKGFDQYEKLYADALLWFKEGWLDFFTPQLYWPICQVPQSFPVLLEWWQTQNVKERHLWPGMSFGSARKTGRYELIDQIMIIRGIVQEAPGHVLFSMKGLMNNSEFCGDLFKLFEKVDGPYKTQCLIPSYPWIDNKAPESPDVDKERVEGKLRISWKPKGNESAFYWVVYTKQGKTWSYEILPAKETKIDKDDAEDPVTHFAVTAVDRNGNESKKIVMKVE